MTWKHRPPWDETVRWHTPGHVPQPLHAPWRGSEMESRRVFSTSIHVLPAKHVQKTMQVQTEDFVFSFSQWSHRATVLHTAMDPWWHQRLVRFFLGQSGSSSDRPSNRAEERCCGETIRTEHSSLIKTKGKHPTFTRGDGRKMIVMLKDKYLGLGKLAACSVDCCYVENWN